MPTIKTFSPFQGTYNKGNAEFYIEANNNSEADKTYGLIIRNDFIEKDKEILTLDMDKFQINELIRMLQTVQYAD